jgi:hypothetical protein
MNTQLKVYVKQNLKPIVIMESPGRRASFSHNILYLQHESCVKRKVRYSSKEISRGGLCAMNLMKFGKKGFKHEHATESLHETKLETDSHNGITSSMCIFFM